MTRYRNGAARTPPLSRTEHPPPSAPTAIPVVAVAEGRARVFVRRRVAVEIRVGEGVGVSVVVAAGVALEISIGSASSARRIRPAGIPVFRALIPSRRINGGDPANVSAGFPSVRVTASPLI